MGWNERRKKESEKSLRAFDLFNPDGFSEARVWPGILPMLFANGKMYRMAEDEATGLRLLNRYRVIWPES